MKRRGSSSTRYSRGTGARRKFVWARTTIQDAAIAANGFTATNALAGFETQLGASLIGVTVVRLRIWIEVAGTAQLAFGTRIMDDGEFATLTAADSPAGSPHSDWMQFDIASGNSTDYCKVDVGSMRKVEELGQGLLFATGNLTAVADTFDAYLQVGLKLP